MSIENHGSFCNIYGNGGISFGTAERSMAETKIREAGGDPSKYPLFLAEMEKQDKSKPTFAFQIDSIAMFVFNTEAYPEILREVSK